MLWVATALGAVAAALALRLVAVTRGERRLRRRLTGALGELEHLQTAFAKFAPLTVVDQIVSQGVSSQAEKREVTVLFADLQGFTKMSEKLDPSDLVEILNGYFTAMSQAIGSHNGHVSKFIGDGILALFGAVIVNPWQAKDAVDAALAMRRALAEYNVRLAAAGRPQLAIGVGIHRGTVVAGLIGSHLLVEYTVIGDVVNLASRVESLTRTHGVDILVTTEVRVALDASYRLREMPAVAVKGKSEPVVTFAVE